MSYWQDKVVIVTGGSSGLGKQIAARFADAGAKVTIAARGSEKLATVATELSHGGRQILGRNADDLDARAASNVHGVHDAIILHIGRPLHEDHLFRTRIVDLLETRGEVRFVDLFRIDRIASRRNLEHDLVRLCAGGSQRWRGIGDCRSPITGSRLTSM